MDLYFFELNKVLKNWKTQIFNLFLTSFSKVKICFLTLWPSQNTWILLCKSKMFVVMFSVCTWGPNIQRISFFQYFLVMKILLCSPNICRKIQTASLKSLTFGQKLIMFVRIKSLNEWMFSNISWRFLNPNIFSILNHNCSNVLDLSSRNKLKKHSVSKIVLTFYCSKKLF